MMLLQGDFRNLSLIFNYQPYLLNTVDRKGRTLLHVLVWQGYPLPLIKYMLNEGASVKIAEPRMKQTVFHFAALKSQLEYMSTLLEHDPKAFSVCDENWNTPLHLICSRKTPCIPLLLLVFQYKNVKVHEKNKTGERPEACSFEWRQEPEAPVTKFMEELFAKYKENGTKFEFCCFLVWRIFPFP